MRFPRMHTCFSLVLIVLLCLVARMLWVSKCTDWTVMDGTVNYGYHRKFGDNKEAAVMVKRDELIAKDGNGRVYTYHNEMPIVFIGGFPRSGTTLMRAMLDAHPEVRCGEETRVIPRILGMRGQWKRNEKEWKRLLEAGVTDEVLDAAISSFILEVVAKHGQPAPRLCNKDPFALKSTEYLSDLFPNAKFILMLRDGRAAVNSMISRGVTITGFDLKNPRQCLEKWNQAVSQMYHQCYLVGDRKCYPMYYEQLVLHPEKHMRDLSNFLNLPWNDSVLHHEMFIGNKISLSKTEKSTDQVVKPVNTDSLISWVGKFPQEVVRDMAVIAPMLAHLGYDPNANPPDYGRADDFVLRKTEDLHKNKQFWEKKVAEVYNQTGKPTMPPTPNSNEPAVAYYGGGQKAENGGAVNETDEQSKDGKREESEVAKDKEWKEKAAKQPPVDLEAMKFTLPPGGGTVKLEDDTV